LSAHQDLQTLGNGVVETRWSFVAVVVTAVGDTDVTEVAVAVVVPVLLLIVIVTEFAVAVVLARLLVVVVVATHCEHPVQQSHEHLNDQLSELCAQKDLHSPVVVAVVVDVTGVVVVVVPSVAEVPGMH